MRLYCTQEEEDYWMGEPIYEENKSVGFHRMWFLDVLSRKTDFDISLQSQEGYFTKRMSWSDLHPDNKLRAYIIHRTLLCNEIVFDLDAKDYEQNVENFKSIYPRLKELGYFPYVYYSGNKGLHIHLFLSFKSLVKDLDMKIQKRIVKHYARAETFEKQFTKFITNKIQWAHRYFSVDKAINQTNHLIRAEGSLNKIGFKTFLGHTPEEIPSIAPVFNLENKEYPKFPFHEITDSLETIKYSHPTNLVSLCEEFVKAKKIGIQEPTYKTLTEFFDIKPKDKSCIKFLQTADFANLQEGRKRALFILASHYKDDPQQITILQEWNNKILDNHLSDFEIQSSAKSTTGKVSCKYTHEFLESIGCNQVCKGCSQ